MCVFPDKCALRSLPVPWVFSAAFRLQLICHRNETLMSPMNKPALSQTAGSAEGMKVFVSQRTNWNATEMPTAPLSLYLALNLARRGKAAARLRFLMMRFKWAAAERGSEVALKRKRPWEKLLDLCRLLVWLTCTERKNDAGILRR